MLKKASVRGKGNHLGPVGATIVAEVLLRLVQGRSASYLSAQPAFRPELGKVPGVFTMADLLALAGVVNPVGDL